MTLSALVFAAALLSAPAPSPGPNTPQAPPRASVRYAAGDEAAGIPLEVAGDGLPFVQGQVQGNKVWLLLDTASPSVLSRRVSDRLGLQGEDAVASGADPRATPVRLLHDLAVELPGARVVQPTVSSFDLDRLQNLLGHRIDGILGSPFFEGAVVEIDPVEKTLSVSDPSARRPAPAGTVVSLTREGGFPYVTASISLPAKPPLQGSFLLDTGADSAVLLYSPFVDRHRLLRSGPSPKTEESSGPGGGNLEAVLRADAIAIGPLVLDKPIVRLSRSSRGLLADPRHAGLLGAPVLARFRATFDYAHGRLTLQKNARFADAFGYDASGLSLSAQGADLSTFEIRRVSLDSPASRVGLKAGDVVLAVDGKPSKEIGLTRLRRMLEQDGKTYALSVFREGKIERFTLTCRRQL